MALTLEDLDRRVTALERAAETEKNIVRAVSEIVSESEGRMRAEMSEMRGEVARLRTDMHATEARLKDQMDSTKSDIIDAVNEKFDAVMVAIDRLENPPK